MPATGDRERVTWREAGIEDLGIEPFDGRYWEANVGSIRTLLLTLLGVFVGLGCDASFVEAGPVRECSEVAAQCVLAKGPLGVCEQIPCPEGESAPCLVCTSQH
jgi:hypothetical protein